MKSELWKPERELVSETTGGVYTLWRRTDTDIGRAIFNVTRKGFGPPITCGGYYKPISIMTLKGLRETN